MAFKRLYFCLTKFHNIFFPACLLIGELPDSEVNPSESCLRLLQNIEMFLRVFENVIYFSFLVIYIYLLIAYVCMTSR